MGYLDSNNDVNVCIEPDMGRAIFESLGEKKCIWKEEDIGLLY
jgi:hypothetical protein